MAHDDGFQIRPYQTTDHERIVELNRYGLRAAGVPDTADVYAGDLDDIAASYLNGRGTMLIGTLGARVVAMGGLREVDQDICEILRMRVDSEAQGRGYGRAILQALEQHARRNGFTTATLLTGPEQHPAIDLYLSAGYTWTADENHGPVRGVRLAKSLTQPDRPGDGHGARVAP
ncbi:MAG: GNAT family N-acetyltransferase [Catenulispora sp.]|nr:GNAT family N-acetyltransferase [Catenulispora sp.]NUT40017.1 GNAT family N-acetyltransferase [Thermoactinospora sp.]